MSTIGLVVSLTSMATGYVGVLALHITVFAPDSEWLLTFLMKTTY